MAIFGPCMEPRIKKIDFPAVDGRPPVIAGPCSAESPQQLLDTALALSSYGVRVFRAGVWKPRTKPGGFEGVGSQAFEWLDEVRRRTSIAICVEVATPQHVEEALARGTEILWIGARTTANPFAVQEIADALKGCDIPVLVKNPPSPDIELWCGAVERLREAGIGQIGLIHRGFTTFDGDIYRNAPLWHIPIEMKRRYGEMTLICDPSHIGGRRELVAPISQQALDLSFDALMIESHCNPDAALSDARQQLTPEALEAVLSSLAVRDNSPEVEGITLLRSQIDGIDGEIISLLARRMRLSDEIGEYKREHNMPLLQSGRYREIVEKRSALGASMGLDKGFITRIMEEIHRQSIARQMGSRSGSDAPVTCDTPDKTL